MWKCFYDHYPALSIAPIVTASVLTSFSDLSPIMCGVMVVALVVVLGLFSIVGKIVRANPEERLISSLLVGLAAGLLAVTLAFAGEVANPFGIVGAAMIAAYSGPGFLKSKAAKKDS